MVHIATRSCPVPKVASLIAVVFFLLLAASGSSSAFSAEGGQNWSDPATQGGSVPGEGESVTIPAGKTVVLDASPPPLAGLQVDGTLRFEHKDLTLSSGWIMVHGRLEVGTEAAPFRREARIVLTGNDKTRNVVNMGAKVLGVMCGVLDIHGQERRGWTRLAANTAGGAAKFTAQNASGWEPATGPPSPPRTLTRTRSRRERSGASPGTR